MRRMRDFWAQYRAYRQHFGRIAAAQYAWWLSGQP